MRVCATRIAAAHLPQPCTYFDRPFFRSFFLLKLKSSLSEAHKKILFHIRADIAFCIHIRPSHTANFRPWLILQDQPVFRVIWCLFNSLKMMQIAVYFNFSLRLIRNCVHLAIAVRMVVYGQWPADV